MSKIEVNTVAPQCGTTLTLGESGDTVALGSGASQTGFGRTGTVDWVTTPKVTGDSPITAVTGKGYFLNTTAGTITINLPAGAAGSIVSMADYAGTWQTNNVTVSPNGSEKIGGIAKSAALAAEGQSVTFVYVDSTQGWINIMDSTSNVRGSEYIVATGGTISTCGDCRIHTFTGNGTLAVSQVHPCAANNVVSYMVVAGGGAGGSSWRSGGGGAGGFREYKSPVTPYTASPLDGNPGGTSITVSATPYPIAVGGGGASGGPALACKGCSGSVSTFSTVTSAGGGVAGTYNPSSAPDTIGTPGGSGGGGGGDNSGPSAAGNGNDPSTSPPQGKNGGAGPAGGPSAGGGGGGATAAGGNAPFPSLPAGNAGGAGATTGISGANTAYAGGGGGGMYACIGGASPSGGTGGGGQGGTEASPSTYPALGTPAGPHSGTANTGGGGGGKAGTSLAVLSGAGGSGVVIIRYKYK